MIEREKAQIGVLISLHEPTGPMHAEAAAAGLYSSRLAQELPTPPAPHGARVACWPGYRLSTRQRDLQEGPADDSRAGQAPALAFGDSSGRRGRAMSVATS